MLVRPSLSRVAVNEYWLPVKFIAAEKESYLLATSDRLQMENQIDDLPFAIRDPRVYKNIYVYEKKIHRKNLCQALGNE